MGLVRNLMQLQMNSTSSTSHLNKLNCSKPAKPTKLDLSINPPYKPDPTNLPNPYPNPNHLLRGNLRLCYQIGTLRDVDLDKTVIHSNSTIHSSITSAPRKFGPWMFVIGPGPG